MIKHILLYLAGALIVAGVVTSCNSDSEFSNTEVAFNNCAVTSFKLQRNDNLLYRLDSVFFAIDLVNAEIFNADSLPVGSNVTKLAITVGTQSASACNVTYRIHDTERDTTVNLIDSPNDSINFADGPVKLEIISRSGVAKRTYNVRVNVHNVAPDTLWWDEDAIKPLPTGLSAVKAQKSVMFNGEIYCYTTDGAAVSLSLVTDPYEMTAVTSAVNMPAGVDLSSLTASADAIYCLDADGNLYSSPDGETWNGEQCVMTYIYGVYGSTLLGALKEDDGWKQVQFPAGEKKALPAGCPVKGTSALVEFTSKWNITPTALFFGGVDAEGNCSADAWVYDGNLWARLSNRPAPVAVEGVTLFPYNTPKVNPVSWKVTDQSALLALGGRLQGGEMNGTVFVSHDFGITWTKGSAALQLPSYYPAVSGADVFVVNRTLYVTDIPAAAPVRVIAPVREWECPFIYVFGGVDKQGALVPTVRRGVINRYSFIPVY